MTVPRLDVRSLTVQLDPHGPPTLDAISFEVGVGEIVAVLGPSGGGKSTLLRSVAGLERVSAGSVRLDGRDITDVPPHRRDLALMFQQYALFPHLDVAANVAYGLRMRSVGRAERNSRVAELLDLVRLGGFGDRSVDSLSGGERQRVALARALATEPAVLMLDEPLSALDRSLRRSLLAELEGLFRQRGLSVVHVTHDQDEAFAIADRIVILRDGRIERSGTADDLWTRPGSESVARFLGHRSLVPRSAIAGLIDGSGPVPQEEMHGAGRSAGGGSALVLVHDSAIDIRPATDGPGDAVVESSRFVGGRFELGCRLLGSEVGLHMTVTREVAARLVPGTAARIRIDAAGVHDLDR